MFYTGTPSFQLGYLQQHQHQQHQQQNTQQQYPAAYTKVAATAPSAAYNSKKGGPVGATSVVGVSSSVGVGGVTLHPVPQQHHGLLGGGTEGGIALGALPQLKSISSLTSLKELRAPADSLDPASLILNSPFSK